MRPQVSVIIPWRGGCPHRELAVGWVSSRYLTAFPSWEVVVGHAAVSGPWCKATAVADALPHAGGRVLVVADADVWAPGVGDAVDQVQGKGAGERWAIPHHLVHRLTPQATTAVLNGDPIQGRPGRSRMLRLERTPYAGIVGGGIVVLARHLYDQIPLDPRFAGWGGEDHAWGYALTALAGRPWRTPAPLWHLWHPPQPRLTRVVGSVESEALRRRYAAARHHQPAMRELIEEAKDMATPRIRYRANFGGTRKIMTSPEMAAVMKKRAEAALPYAQGIAPVESGEYAGAFTVGVVRRGGPRKNRAEARLINEAGHAADVERRHRILGRTVDQIERGG